MRYVLRDAVFSSKYMQYIAYRMRFFLPVSLVTLTSNILEFFLIKKTIAAALISQIVLMRLIEVLLLGGWWGCLGVAREFIRSRYSFADKDSINQYIVNWQILSLLFSGLLILFPLHYFFQNRLSFPPEEILIYDLYLVGFVISAFLDFWFQVYHSGAFAIRRVYRPLGWVLGPGVIALALFLLLWRYVGALGLPIAFIASKGIEVAIKVYYTNQTYRDLRLNPIRSPSWKSLRDFIVKMSKWNAITAYLAGICLNIENLLIIIFFAKMEKNPSLIIYLFILRDIYHAYGHWGVMFFYYDLKKLRMGAFPPFYKTFIKKLFPTSFLISGLFYLVTIPATYIFYRSHFLSLSVIVFVFFVFASFFSYIVIHTFSQNRYADLVVAALLATGILILGEQIAVSLFEKSVALLISLIFIVLFLLKKHFPSMGTIDGVKKQSIYTLFFNLEDLGHGFSVAKVKTNPKLGSKNLNNFLSEVALCMDQRGFICPLRSNEFLLIETRDHRCLSPSLLSDIRKDMVKSYSVTEADTREACLELAYQEAAKEMAENPFYKKLKSEELLDFQVSQLFQEHFPEGEKIDLAKGDLLFQNPEKEKIYASIESSYMVPLSLMRGCFYLAPLFLSSCPPVLFLIRKEGKKFKKLLNWSKFMLFVNFENFRKTNYRV